MAMTQAEESRLAVSYRIPRWSPSWAVPEVPVPESDTHDAAIEYLRSLLLFWAARQGHAIKIARNLGIRWVRKEPRCGFDPDLCVIDPAPSDEPLTGYVDTPERALACGIRELWIYDPMLAGPKVHGGPQLLQIFRQTPNDTFERIYEGEGPAYSSELAAWLHPQKSKSPAGAKLGVSDDRAGQERWLTDAERMVRAVEAERTVRAERDAVQSRVRELEADLEQLRRRG